MLDRLGADITGGRPFSGADRQRAVARFGQRETDMLMVIAQTAAAARNWHRVKVVHRLHLALTAELVDADPGDRLPCEVFRRLPHPDPCLTLPEPIEVAPAQGSAPVSRPSQVVSCW